MPEYRNFIGFVQFDVNEREYSGQPLKDFVIQPVGSGGGTIRVTLWPELSHADVKKGDSVHVAGKFETPTVKGKQYFNLSATDLTLNGVKIEKRTEEISNPVEDEDEDLDDLGF